MANLTHSGTTITTSASWEAAVTQSAKTKTYHFNTASTYVDQDIDLKVTAKTGTISASAGATATNATLSDNNTSGISIVSTGSATIETAGWLSTSDSKTHTATNYITGVVLQPGKSFSITVPNGNETDTITFTFTAHEDYSVTVE